MITVFLLVGILVCLLESEELVHGRKASDWYVSTLDVMSIAKFS